MKHQKTHKMCPRCRQIKSVSEFWKNRSSHDGLGSYCSQCGRVLDRIRRPRRGPNKKQIERRKLISRGLKRCSLCKEIKPLRKFTKDKHKDDGHISRCKSCISPQHHRAMRERKRLFKMGVKQCSQCKKIKVLNDFGPDKSESSRDGYVCWCHECCNKNSREYYQPQENEENREIRELALFGFSERDFS